MDTQPRTFVVIGGVAGGMSFAARARRLDEAAHIIVLEQGDYVSFANCGLPYYVGGDIESDDSLLLHTPDSLKAALNLDVRIRTRAEAIDPAAQTVTATGPDGTQVISYDTLVLSPGGIPLTPPVDGLDSPLVHTLRTVGDARRLREAALSATTAVVLGAGFIGLEAAEALIHRGITTHVVELSDHVLPPLEKEMAWLVTEELRSMGALLHTGVGAEALATVDDTTTVTLSNGETIEADLVVLSAGVRPDTGVAEAAGIATDRGAIVTDDHGQTNIPNIYAVGDATVSRLRTGSSRVVALAGPANRAGRLVADHAVTGSARPLPALSSTAIVRIGSLTAAMTGANRAQLEDAGTDYTTIHLHPNQHAGYFPGASQMHLMVHVGSDGAILGAQGVGVDGIDKRIDVLATAMTAGMTATDLIDLDLCYSPPYGQAKDAINLVGMIADNVSTGKLHLAYPADLVDTTDVVLDVRTAGEFAAGHVPGAINIPHTELRDRMNELSDIDRPLIVMCAAGVRSWIAYNVVTAAGHSARMLSGGSQTIAAWFGDNLEMVWTQS